MANISQFLTAIKNAVYGEEVRLAIHDALDAMNKEIMSYSDDTIAEAINQAKEVIIEANQDNSFIDSFAETQSVGSTYQHSPFYLSEQKGYIDPYNNGVFHEDSDYDYVRYIHLFYGETYQRLISLLSSGSHSIGDTYALKWFRLRAPQNDIVESQIYYGYKENANSVEIFGNFGQPYGSRHSTVYLCIKDEFSGSNTVNGRTYPVPISGDPVTVYICTLPYLDERFVLNSFDLTQATNGANWNENVSLSPQLKIYFNCLNNTVPIVDAIYPINEVYKPILDIEERLTAIENHIQNS